MSARVCIHADISEWYQSRFDRDLNNQPLLSRLENLSPDYQAQVGRMLTDWLFIVAGRAPDSVQFDVHNCNITWEFDVGNDEDDLGFADGFSDGLMEALEKHGIKAERIEITQ